MKRISALMLVVACGQMYRKPGDPDQPVQPAPAEPGGAAAAPMTSQPEAAHAVARDNAAAAAPMPSPAANPVAQRFVDAHNRVRAKHCAAPLTWAPKLAAVAQKWADSLRDQGCKFGHSGGQYGENLAAGSEGALDPEGVVKMWYDEISKYRFPDGGFSMETGHFTQVVWRGTTQVGCGQSACNGMQIFVCNYDPAGNVETEYRDNVKPVGCK